MDPYEMVRYFSDFLQEIQSIITNIKSYVYEMIEVYLPLNKMTVEQSMSSIILSTHKTFDDLKKIQSIISGVSKSRKIINHKRTSFYDGQTKFMECQHPSIGKIQTQMKSEINSNEIHSINETKTIKRELKKGRVQAKVNEIKQKNDQSRLKLKMKQSIVEQDEKTIKNQSQYSTNKHKDLTNKRNKIGQQVNKIIKISRLNLSNIMDRNNQCLRLVRSAQKQLKIKL